MYMTSSESAAGGLLEPKGRPRLRGVGTGARAAGEVPVDALGGGGCIPTPIGPPLLPLLLLLVLLLVATLMVLLLLLM